MVYILVPAQNAEGKLKLEDAEESSRLDQLKRDAAWMVPSAIGVLVSGVLIGGTTSKVFFGRGNKQLLKRNEELNEQIRKLDEESQAISEKLRTGEKLTDQQKADLTRLQAKLDQEKSTRVKMQRDSEALRKSFRQIKIEKESAESSKDVLRETLSKTQYRVKELTEELTESLESMKVTTEKKESLEAKIQDLNTTIERYETRIRELEVGKVDAAELIQQNELLNNKVENLNEELNRGEADFNKMYDIFIETEKKYKALEKELNDQIEGIQEEITILAAELMNITGDPEVSRLIAELFKKYKIEQQVIDGRTMYYFKRRGGDTVSFTTVTEASHVSFEGDGSIIFAPDSPEVLQELGDRGFEEVSRTPNTVVLKRVEKHGKDQQGSDSPPNQTE